ncbi:MAG: hypothetical protein H0U23_03970, partial [Blastocatellia bacterium]|nr:hypothetical protein [Blastocatellia bacterium]
MKRCPECRRDYHDDTLSFCLADGTELVYGLSYEIPATAILSEPGADRGPQTGSLAGVVDATGFPRSEDQTRSQIHTTDQTAIFPLGAEAEPHKDLGDSWERQSLSAHRAAKPLGVIGIAVVLLVGGYFGYLYFKPTDSGQINSVAVLPFQNRSGDPNSEYLSDGLAESLIYRLTKLPNVKVSPT